MFSCCFFDAFLNNFFVPYGWMLNRVGVKFLTSNQNVKRASGTMSLDGSPRAKTVYGQSSKILFKQKWDIPIKFTVLVHFWLGQIYPLKSLKILLKVKLFKNLHPQEYQLANTIPGPRIFCKSCATVLYHNNTQLAPLKNFSRSIIEQNEDIASYNFKIFPWLTRNLPNSFYSFENYLAEFLRVMHHAFFRCHQVEILNRART